MAEFTLQQMDLVGETSYITKHNANYAAVQAAIRSLQTAAGSGGAGGASAFIGQAMFGTESTLVGEDSYAVTQGLADDQIDVAPGFCWLVPDFIMGTIAAPVTLSLLGQTTGTFYVDIDALGLPSISPTLGPRSAYSLSWNELVVTAITRVMPLSWGYTDFLAAQVSAAVGQSYNTLDARLEAIETAANAGPNDFYSWNPGVPAAGEILLRGRAARAFTFPANLPNSYVECLVAPTAETVVTLKKGGVQFATATFAAAALTATLVLASDEAFAAGDILTAVAADPQDSTLADLSLTLAGTR